MNAPSVIVVSRHRPAALRCCLRALTQQDHPRFEVIVVADREGIAAAAGFRVKTVEFDEANISAARNAGLALVAGDLVAFIDDDAVAEPTWLSRLVAPFADLSIGAATGFVRGRNGISRQWGAAWIDHFGADHPFELDEAGGVFDAGSDRAIKTQGTNCAFRRDALLAAGGFDPAYRFYHDETDVNLRMRARTAVVPLAQVVHGFAPSAQRREDRVPVSLVDIGASTAVFLRRHSPEGPNTAELLALRQMQRLRLDRHVQAGRISAAEAEALLAGLDQGWAAGMTRDLRALTPLTPSRAAFLPLPETGPRGGRVLTSRSLGKSRAMAKAARLAASGQIVTLFCLSFSARPHWLRFTEDGFWVQEGGIFGRSNRASARFRLTTLSRRVKVEQEFAQKYRPIV